MDSERKTKKEEEFGDESLEEEDDFQTVGIG